METPGRGPKVDDDVDFTLAGVLRSLDKDFFVTVFVPLHNVHSESL
jgi:hypothetical protein